LRINFCRTLKNKMYSHIYYLYIQSEYKSQAIAHLVYYINIKI